MSARWSPSSATLTSTSCGTARPVSRASGGSPRARPEQLLGPRAHGQVAVEELVGDGAFRVDHDGAGVRDPVPGMVVRVDQGVQDAERPDDIRFRIGKQRVGDAVGIAEVPERIGLVIAQGVQGDFRRVEVPNPLLQLDELHSAGRSPDRGAIEDEHRRPPGAVRVQIEPGPVRRYAPHVRHGVADRGAGREIAPGDRSSGPVPG